MSDQDDPSASVSVGWGVWQFALGTQLFLTSSLWLGMCLAMDLPSRIEVIDVLFFSLLVWQCLMLGFWAGLGNKRWRIPLIVLLSPMLGLLSSFAVGGQIWQFQLFCLGIIAITTLTTVLLRLLAGRLVRLTRESQVQDGLQFGIKQVFVWTTIAAVLFGAGRLFASELWPGRANIDDVLVISGLAFCLSLSTVFLVWGLLSGGVSAGRIGALLFAGLLGLAGIQWLDVSTNLFTWTLLVSHLQVALTLILLRNLGYRFVGHQKSVGPE